MVDVRALVSLARIVMVASFVVGVGLWIAAARIGKKDKGAFALQASVICWESCC